MERPFTRIKDIPVSRRCRWVRQFQDGFSIPEIAQTGAVEIWQVEEALRWGIEQMAGKTGKRRSRQSNG